MKLVITAMAITAGLMALFVVGPTIDPSLSCLARSGQARTFTILITADGFNNSKSNLGQGNWPVMDVTKCDNVTLLFVNNDTGFHEIVVGTYAVRPSAVEAGQTLSLNFVAFQQGEFKVFCVEPCFAHAYLQNGQLTVA